uniref:FZ domain-containing protein n=4 Tax=Triticinae TaxID=1648030 RepID=A0A8R7Q2D9_TRIUA
MCHDVLVRDSDGQHCAPSELSILQQLEAVVLVPNYNRLMPSGRTFLNFFNNANCAAAAKRLACWISIQRCDEDGDNRLRVCYSACELYNTACGAGLDCSDQTLFSKREEEEKGVPCTGYGEKKSSWI